MPEALGQIIVIALVIIGAFTALAWLSDTFNPLPPVGVVCYDMVRSTATGRQHSRHCELEQGWHWEYLRGDRVPVRD
jgi:hypothetical protein